MADRREQILSRLLVLAGDVEGIVKAARNDIDPNDGDLPFVGILEGDEEADQASPISRGRPASGPAFLTMTPELVLVVLAGSENVGTDLNTLRARIIKSVLGDATLAGYVGTNGSIRYAGLASDLGVGRAMLGRHAMRVAFTYPLIQSEI